MFDADRPITNSRQDRLGRTVFAKYLARCLLDHKDPESLVVGLYGGWGVGKTSIINLVIEELDFAASNMEDSEKPIILNFSPWSYSGQNKLVYSFFRRLSSALRKVDHFENVDRIIYLLELYVSFFTQQPIPKTLQANRSWWQKLTLRKQEGLYGWESGRDLTQVKAELNELLRNQKHKIIIIIDNISRLYDVEIKQMFQIIKSMGDYANTEYLLAFDKTQVSHALNRLESGSAELIEKIVQLPFEIPPILQQDLEMIFADRLEDVIVTVPEGAWSIEHWADIYYSSLRYCFKNCRDITRYVNTLSFSYSRLKDIVNPVDFFALTAIEVFSPNVYFGIRDNKDLFTDLLDNVYNLDMDQIQKDRSRCDEILSRREGLSRELLLDLMVRLCPRLRQIYYPEKIFYHSDAIARKLRRICSPDLFDAYFRLSMQTGHIQNSEFETILAMASDANMFDQALTRLNQDGRILKFLDQLDSKFIYSVPQQNIAAIINALIDNGDLFPNGICGPLSLDTPMRIHRIIHVLLHRLEKSETRFILLQEAIAKATKSIYIIVHELREQGREHLEESDVYVPVAFRDITPQQLTSLQKLTVSRIENWARNGSLASHPSLVPLLTAWREWGNPLDCARFVEQLTKTDRGLVTFLTTILDKAIAQTMTHYVRDPGWVSYLQDINLFVPIETLVPNAKALFEDDYFEKLTEREQLALMIFLDIAKAETLKVIPKTSEA